VKDIPRLKHIMLYLLDAIFYGKAGAQFQWGVRKVAGNRWNSVISSTPLNGDKLRFKSDGTPGIAIRTASEGYDDNENAFLNAYADCIEFTMLGEALFLNHPFLRDRFAIHMFNPSDTDYLFELEQQQSRFGLGLRSRLYWVWNLRVELLSWMVNALQRVGANGMIFGFYEEGNYAMQGQVIDALRQLAQDNYSAFPVKGGQLGQHGSKGVVDRIEPAAVGYDVLMQLIEWCEGIMRRAFLGQDLSSVAKPTGIGAGAAQLQGDVRADFITYDAGLLAETLTEQLLSVILKYNKFIYDGREMYGDELPFSCRLEFQIQRENVQEAIDAAEKLYGMGVKLDEDDLRNKAGLAPPKRKETEVSNPQLQQQKHQAKATPGMIKSAKKMSEMTGMTHRMMRDAFEKSQRRHGHHGSGRGHAGRHREFVR